MGNLKTSFSHVMVMTDLFEDEIQSVQMMQFKNKAMTQPVMQSVFTYHHPYTMSLILMKFQKWLKLF